VTTGDERPEPTDAPDVLVLRALGLGDGLTAVPALRGLRRAFPGSRLVLAAPAAIGELLKGFQIVDDVLVTRDLQALPAVGPGRTVGVNLHGSGPLSHQRLLGAGVSRLIGFRNDEAGHRDGPLWSDDEHEVDRWCRLVHSAGGSCTREDLRLVTRAPGRPGGYVLVHPGAAAPARRWPAERWAEVVARIAQAGRTPLVTGGPGEEELTARVVQGSPDAVDLGGRLTLPRLVEAVAETDLLICGDTGVAHLATAVSTPSVLLFGPTPPQHWGPAIDPHLHRVIWPSRPGGRRSDPNAGTIDPVLEQITVSQVMAEVERMLAGSAGDERLIGGAEPRHRLVQPVRP
jgi:ADP-heptose:LPS heptosyltransferase